MNKNLQLNTGDWKKDPALSMCGPGTRGIWIDLLCSLHDGGISGVTGTAEQLARLCRCGADAMQLALEELERTGAANVSRDGEMYTVVCRRMKKAEDTSKKRAAAGSKGGSKTASKREARPEAEDDAGCCRLIEEYCVSLGLPKSDGEAVFNKWQGNGWINGRVPILDWKATIRSWKLQGYLPSQRPVTNGQKPWVSAKDQEQARIDAANREYRLRKLKEQPRVRKMLGIP